MILDLEESKELCDWLLERGLGLGECAWVLADLAAGDSFAIALVKVFDQRKKNLEAIHEKFAADNWSCPLTP